jgi:dipeptidyl aminopeptidase/acylaminoacyl peptidase
VVPEDVYHLVSVGDPRVSPDGKTVAFVVTRIDKKANEYRSAVWICPTDGSVPARPFTAGSKRDHSARWSPDGRSIAFVSNRDAEAGHLYVISLDGGEPRRITELKTEPSEPAWSPDGSRIAFAARVPDPAYDESDDRKRKPRRFTRLQYKLDSVGWTGDRPTRIFVVPSDGSREPVQITDGDGPDGSPSWSPDGTRIAFVSARHEHWDTEPARDIFVADALTGSTPELLTSTDGSCSGPSWSPDGDKIAYRYNPGIWDSPRHTQIAVLDVASRQTRVLTQGLDRQCSPFFGSREPIWVTPDRVLFGIEDRGSVHLYWAPVDGSAPPVAVLAGEQSLSGWDIAGGMGVHVASTPTSLTELFCGERQVTQLGAEFARARTLHPAERFTAISKDGSEVDAWVMRPAAFEPGRRYPVLLNIHGGPFTQYGNGFFDEFQVYTGAGYVVLFSNPRGSSGYAEEWGRAIRGPIDGGPGWGTVDYDDVMAVVDTALERFDFCDAGRLGVMGGSYGGYLTSWIVGHTGRFKAACSERAVNNWVSMYGSSDAGYSFRSYFGGFVWEDIGAYLKHSPITYATDITTPLIILHSENDLRCPIEQAEGLFITLRLLGRDVELVRFPSESHELSRAGSPVHRVLRFETILEFFDRHLKAVDA